LPAACSLIVVPFAVQLHQEAGALPADQQQQQQKQPSQKKPPAAECISWTDG
jgi:hypothetical protein